MVLSKTQSKSESTILYTHTHNTAFQRLMHTGDIYQMWGGGHQEGVENRVEGKIIKEEKGLVPTDVHNMS